ncbi:lysophospholipid acyltransferase family protein [Mycobacterium sp. IDR2000157661]|uniref:lysophospholipid acyltransferase family protein n=1 Tax=Mycobacterium sp. IDR2000157661 TaxID=2867005 RepID=UPI001EEE6402|nr:lysophospholipid acyltransferase family protein [Mycobacterium sp. IDR2000157661]ULE35129.1 acyltransferase family protein [Mycobacterium sp. IDR2000157661]
MTTTPDVSIDRIVNEPSRVQVLRRRIFAVADGLAPAVDLCRIYVDGLENLPCDGRFLLVGNHTLSGSSEVVLIPYFVHRELGVRVRGLATRQIGEARGLLRDVLEAAGAVPGLPDTCAELMRRGETILVFPGGGRDMLKFKGEEYTLQWHRRSGFARLAAAHDYPIVPVGLVGGDDVYHSLVERDGPWERWSRGLGERLHGLPGVGVPIVRGLGPTMIPRPQRMYLRFASPIDTSRPSDVEPEKWVDTVKERTQTALETTLAELQQLRATDPFRNLNPFAWSNALQPR